MRANLVNLFDETILEADIVLRDGLIASIQILGKENPALPYAMPGFVDAHVHIESSMLTPCQFARMAVTHGTVATVSDPHEVANVLGMEGVSFMLADAERTPFKFCFGAPSCVPATVFETAGATLGPDDIKKLLLHPKIGYLAEVMNYPGVLQQDPDMMAKIKYALQYNKPIDGHAPGLRGEDARKYIEAGITTDHECFTYEEALEKIGYGMKILIREGSAARNFDALIPLLDQFPHRVMFCSDDKHPDNLLDGHINILVKRALDHGCNFWNVLRAASLNPITHYSLNVGLLRPGDPGDYILVDNLSELNITETWINGTFVAEKGKSLLPDLRSSHINRFECTIKNKEDFQCTAPENSSNIRVIEALEGQLITHSAVGQAPQENGYLTTDTTSDLLKIVVVNRYFNAKPALAFVRNFGLKKGAIASSVAHDSHNIVAVGADDQSICEAINLIIESKGGIAAVGNEQKNLIALPIAGLMTDADGYEVARSYTKLDAFAKTELGSTLKSPYMTLSFMALLVIPSLKLSDKGLFDGDKFRLVSLSAPLDT